jgi:hypothetical protein
LLREGCTDVGYNSGQGGWAEADRSGKCCVFVRASKRHGRKLKYLVVLSDCCSYSRRDQGVGGQGEVWAMLLEGPDG